MLPKTFSSFGHAPLAPCAMTQRSCESLSVEDFSTLGPFPSSLCHEERVVLEVCAKALG